MNDYSKVNPTNGASNFAYNNNQGNPSTVYNSPGTPKMGYGSLSGGRPGSVPSAPVGPPMAPVAPPVRAPMAPPAGIGRGMDYTVDPRESMGFGQPTAPAYGESVQPIARPGLSGTVMPNRPAPGNLNTGIQGIGLGANNYWANMRQQRQDRLAKFKERFQNNAQTAPYLPIFGGR